MGTESKYFLKRIWKWPPVSTGEKKKCNVKPMRWLFLTCALQRTTFGKLDCLTVPAQAQQVCRNFLHMFLYLFTLEKKKKWWITPLSLQPLSCHLGWSPRGKLIYNPYLCILSVFIPSSLPLLVKERCLRSGSRCRFFSDQVLIYKELDRLLFKWTSPIS